MATEIDKFHTGKCPITNDLRTIQVSYLCSPFLEGTAYQKYSFSCNNTSCDYLLNKTCPIYKNIPFTSTY